MRLEFTIPVAPRTKKNHSQIIYNQGRPMLIPSKEYRQYEKDVFPFIPKVEKPIDFPVTLACTFYKPTRRRCDLVGHLQSIQDILVKYGVLEDDCDLIVFSVDGSRVVYDKIAPRTVVIITDEVIEHGKTTQNI